jgi:hypothetical protein
LFWRVLLLDTRAAHVEPFGIIDNLPEAKAGFMLRIILSDQALGWLPDGCLRRVPGFASTSWMAAPAAIVPSNYALSKSVIISLECSLRD